MERRTDYEIKRENNALVLYTLTKYRSAVMEMNVPFRVVLVSTNIEDAEREALDLLDKMNAPLSDKDAAELRKMFPPDSVDRHQATTWEDMR